MSIWCPLAMRRYPSIHLVLTILGNAARAPAITHSTMTRIPFARLPQALSSAIVRGDAAIGPINLLDVRLHRTAIAAISGAQYRRAIRLIYW